MIRVKMTVDVVTNMLQQGAKHNNLEVIKGIRPNSVLTDVDWDEVTNVVSYIFDINDGDDNIYDQEIIVNTSTSVTQTPLF